MKIEEQVLSREQMAHLRELGVDTSDASMIWISCKSANGTDNWYLYINNELSRGISRVMNNGVFVPTYTVADIIEKLPDNIGGRDFIISKIKGISGITITQNGYADFDFRWLKCFSGSNVKLINVLYKLLCWVAENHKELIK